MSKDPLSGIKACVFWCNRYGQRRERLPGAPDREVSSLAQLPALVGAA
jgi:2-haloacid dehalogenase